MYWKGGGFTVRYELTTMWGKMQFLGAFAKLLNAIISFVMSVCPSVWNNSAPTGRIFMKFDT